MEITTTLYVTDRDEWRKWLETNHTTATEIWLIYYKKATGKPTIPYAHAVEEALCFGWIDGIQKSFDTESSAQRFTPRKPKSNWSALNKERVRRLLEVGKMTEAGRVTLPDLSEPFVIPPHIQELLEAAPPAWENFQRFPESYQRLRIGYIVEARKNPEMFRQRLANFVKQTAQNKQFGTMP